MLAKTKLNAIKVLISKALIESYINHDDFVSMNNVLREYYEMKVEIKNPKTSVEYTIENGWYNQKNMKKWCRNSR